MPKIAFQNRKKCAPPRRVLAVARRIARWTAAAPNYANPFTLDNGRDHCPARFCEISGLPAEAHLLEPEGNGRAAILTGVDRFGCPSMG